MSTPTSSSSEKKIISVKIRNKPDPTDDSAILYSKQEIHRFVSEFVSSWIRGDLTIHFPTAAELAKKTPLSIAFPNDPSVSAELKIKEHYVDLISTVTGIKPASAVEKEKAVEEIFKIMLMFRSANRIEGKIISNGIEKRVEKLEETTKNQAKLVDQITGFLFTPKKGRQKKQNN